LTATVDGIAAATSVGIDLKAGRCIYFHGAQFEEMVYPTPICTGDDIGCSYGNVDLSLANSSRLTGRIILPCEDASNYRRAINPECGSITIVYTPTSSSAEIALGATSPHILDTTNHLLELYWIRAENKWAIVNDATTTKEAVASSFFAGTPIVFHLVWGPGKYQLYKNGAILINAAAFTALAMPINLNIGCYTTGSNPAHGVIGDFSTYGWDMTAAEVAAQYADIASRLADGRLESPVPYLHTRLGDGVVDSHSDSGHSHVAVADGIAGNVPADTKFDFSHNVGAVQLLISNLANGEYIPPAVLGSFSAAILNAIFFQDVGQVADTADANAAGGYNKQVDITAEATPSGYGRLCALPNRLLLGDRDYIAYVRLKSSQAAAMAVTIRCKYAPDTSVYDASVFQLGEPKTWSTFVGALTYTTIYSAPVHMQRFRRADAKLAGIGFERIFWWLTLISTPASLQNIDYIGLLPRPIKMIALGTTADKRVVVRGAQVNPGASGEGSVNGYGDDISLEPGKRNIIQVVHAAYTDSDADSLAYNLTFNYIEYAPKWSVM
jgi:hypothetical protein